MATRLYLSNDAATYTPSTKRGAWDVPGASLARKLDTAPIGTNTTTTVAETSANTAWDVLVGRWITEPIDRDGTLSGTVEWIIGALQSISTAAMFWHVHIFVTVGDTDAVRGTLLADNIGATQFPTTATARGEGAKAITSVDVQFGDRVVVEVGYRATNNTSTSRSATINYGSSASNAELASGNTGANLTARPGWVQFSDPNQVLAQHVAWHEDDCNDGTVSATLWPFWSGSGTVSESGGQMRLVAAANNTFGYVESYGRYALRDSAARCWMAPPSAQDSASFANARFALYDLTPGSGNTSVICYVNSVTGNIGWYCTVNGVDQFDEVFTPAVGAEWLLTGAFFKIDETAGTLSFQVSQDGHNWVEVDTQLTPAAILTSTRMTLDLEAIRSTASSAGTPALFDHVNLSPARVLDWSGHSWQVRGGEGQPGPNRWGTTNNSVELDGGDLVLKVAQLGAGWTSAEVDRIGTGLGYGRYRWTYTIDVEHLDHKPVLGLYVYDQDPGSAPSQREIDLEVTKWNAPDETSTMWYSVHPVADGEHRESDHVQSYATPYTGEFVWQAGQVYLRTVDADGVLLGEHVVTQGVQAPGTEQPSMNLWLIEGSAPSDGLPVTARIHSFEFTAGVTHDLVPADEQKNALDEPWQFALKGGAAITGGELVVPCASDYSATAYTGSTFDMRDSATQIEVSGIPEAGGNWSQESLWYLRHDADNYLCMFVSGGGFVGRRRQAGVNADTALGGHDPVAHRFWRIEVSGTTVTYKASPNGATWTTLGTATTTITSQRLSTMRHRFESGHWASESPTPAPFKVAAIGDVAVIEVGAGTANAVELDAVGTGHRAATGVGAQALEVDGVGTGTTVRAGSGTRALTVDATGTGHRTATGVGAQALELDTTGTGTAVRSGTGATPLELDATSTAGPVVRSGRGTASLALDATGVGKSTRRGTASLALDALGTGHRTAAGAAAAGDVTLDASSTGTAHRPGTAAVALELNATSTSSPPARRGAGLARVDVDAAGTGRRDASGSAAVALELDAHGTGTSTHTTTGTASTLTVDATGTGTGTRAGTAGVDVTLDVAAAPGTAARYGGGTAGLTLDATGSGRGFGEGAGGGTAHLELDATGTGTRDSSGNAAQAVELEAAGTGQRVATGTGTATGLALDAEGWQSSRPGHGAAAVTLDAHGAGGPRIARGRGTAGLELTAASPDGWRVTTRSGTATGLEVGTPDGTGTKTGVGAGAAPAVELDVDGTAGERVRRGRGSVRVVLDRSSAGARTGRGAGRSTAALTARAVGTGRVGLAGRGRVRLALRAVDNGGRSTASGHGTAAGLVLRARPRRRVAGTLVATASARTLEAVATTSRLEAT